MNIQTLKKFNIDFMKFRLPAAVLSGLLVILSIVSLFTKQLNLGLDFTGGTLVEVAYEDPAELAPIRQVLVAAGYDGVVVQHFGRAQDVLIRIPPTNEKDKDRLGQDILLKLKALKAETDQSVQLRRIEFVGPQVGEELRDQSGIAMLIALGAMLLYVTFRFRFKFALGAVFALLHDVIIVLGFFSAFSIQFDLTVLAAVLAVIGYSLNDTIVVSDRIRENFKNLRVGTPVEIINGSLNQTLSRTLVTSLTTLLVLFALLLLGGELIFGFALTLTIGVLIGTYSSIYVASNTLLALKVSRDDFIEEVSKDVLDDRP